MNDDPSRWTNGPTTEESGDVFVEGLVAGVSSQLADTLFGDVSRVDGAEEVASMFSPRVGGQPPDASRSEPMVARHFEVCK